MHSKKRKKKCILKVVSMTILVSVWQRLFLPTYFTIQLIFATIYDPTPLFSTIHGYHRIISTNFYLYLQYFNNFFFFLDE